MMLLHIISPFLFLYLFFASSLLPHASSSLCSFPSLLDCEFVPGTYSYAGDVNIFGTVTLTTNGTLDLRVSGTLKIHASGSIDVTGMGYQYEDESSPGPGFRDDFGQGTGGGHGGTGGINTMHEVPYPGQPYGQPFSPTTPGSPGGSGFYNENFEPKVAPGGHGGGVVLITARQVILDGTILANGASPFDGSCSNAGTGAGGSVSIVTGMFGGSGAGLISANGGSCTESEGAGGSGGRIYIHYNQTSFSQRQILASANAYGGRSNFFKPLLTPSAPDDSTMPHIPSAADGAAGTVVFASPNTPPLLVVRRYARVNDEDKGIRRLDEIEPTFGFSGAGVTVFTNSDITQPFKLFAGAHSDVMFQGGSRYTLLGLYKLDAMVLKTSAVHVRPSQVIDIKACVSMRLEISIVMYTGSRVITPRTLTLEASSLLLGHNVTVDNLHAVRLGGNSILALSSTAYTRSFQNTFTPGTFSVFSMALADFSRIDQFDAIAFDDDTIPHVTLDVADEFIMTGHATVTATSLNLLAKSVVLSELSAVSADGRGFTTSFGLDSVQGRGPGAGVLKALDEQIHGTSAGYGGQSAFCTLFFLYQCRPQYPVGGVPYGSTAFLGNEVGSSGAYVSHGGSRPGAGGGRVSILAREYVMIAGTISARGEASTGPSGAGSGGAVTINAPQIAGQGKIDVSGGFAV
eukprot:TRINITY_DN8611_c0_g1_i3.p1 TRINITY_DN8611_c0_g1~~TRINITY_DN8611_c0_g1_i3.p1  ORF type:complete len:687 (+),score=128.26 TRINITY_DN8611_c0_g1_i3:164-2224(+)